MSIRTIVAGVAMAVVVAIAAPAKASLQFDQNVTPGVIFGSGNANGGFTTDRANGIELGLRGKLRHNAVGAPENTFNSNGDGTYTFQAGVAPTQSFPTAEWSYEWSINSNYDGNGANLNAYTYELGLDIDPGPGTNFITFDPINVTYWDHSIGDNSTTSATDFVAANDVEYASLISNYNVAQNSWKAHWYMTPFDPNAVGRYDLYISASNGNGEQARVEAAILVVPEPASLALLGFGGLALLRRRR
ncbi:MAG: PEP-CTERM sorting domain-containing protein [Phycisphaerales bacterium]|nr:PEP-CTERM sorting domain-containing protein [Phycisphaerales bacterium]